MKSRVVPASICAVCFERATSCLSGGRIVQTVISLAACKKARIDFFWNN